MRFLCAVLRAPRTHLAYLRRLSSPALLAMATVECFALMAAFFWIDFRYLQVGGRQDLDTMSAQELFVWLVLVAPVAETFLFQSLPVMIARLSSWGFSGQVAASLFPFAAVHFLLGVGPGIYAGLITGFFLAFLYAHFRSHSLARAVGCTILYHAVHNLIIWSLIQII